MSIEHVTITDPYIHEPKGIAAATINKVYVSDGAASGAWAKLTADQLTGTGNPFGGQLLHVREQAASGTAAVGRGGGTYLATTWVTITLTTAPTNEISSASLSSNQISLPAGTYYIDAQAHFQRVGLSDCWAKTRLRNITDSATLISGMNAENIAHAGGDTTANGLVDLLLRGRFTLSGTKTIAWQVYPVVAIEPVVAVSSGEVEVYSDVMIWKVG